jgi:recombinational DNA repair protein (RecF pathway)
MREYVTEAVVLGREVHREHDWLVDLLTHDLGFVSARVTGGARVTSKLSPHLDPASMVLVRLVWSGRFVVADAAVMHRDFRARADVALWARALESLAVVRALAPRREPETLLWTSIYEVLEGTRGADVILESLGYHPGSASCARCHGFPVRWVVLDDHALLCGECGLDAPSATRVSL